MDSLLVKKIFEIRNLQDTLELISNQTKEAISKLESENLLLKVLPFLGVIIGGLITYYGQKFIKKNELKVILQKSISDSANQAYVNIIQLRFLLNELAYLEVDSKYQYYLSCTETGEDKKKALDEHYNDYKYISDTKSKISNSLGSIISGVITNYKLQGLAVPEEVKGDLKTISDHLLSLPRNNDYEIPTAEEKAQGKKTVTDEMLSKDIAKLSGEYTRHLSLLDKMASEL